MYVALCYYTDNDTDEHDEMIGLEIHNVALDGLRMVKILKIEDDENDNAVETIVHTWKAPE